MLKFEDTIKILTQFYSDCVRFWEREGNSKQEAHKLARADVENIKYDPFSPAGEELHTGAKEEFLENPRFTYGER